MIPKEGTKEFNEFIVAVFDRKIHHKYYPETVEHHENMAVHVEGKTPEKLLDINRPNEPQDVKKYRLEVYKPVTKSLSDKVANTVARIFNPRLYRIEFKDRPARIKEGEGLEAYLTEDYPFYLSVMNFVSKVGLKKLFSDPNGILIIWPDNLEEVGEGEYLKPLPLYKESCDVMFFKDEKYYVYLDEELVCILDDQFLKKYSVDKADKNNPTIQLVYEYQHGIGSAPAFRLGGIIKGTHLPYWFVSFISGVLPHWDKVVTMTSDLDGSIVNHLYPERWEYQVECDNKECRDGYVYKEVKVKGGDVRQDPYTCHRCAGTGKITARGPFGALTINREGLENELPPTPPADYISKDIEPIKELQLIIDKEEQKGFSAINMEILNKVGEDQSGIAKTIDRQDLDAFVMDISNHVFKYILPNIIFYTAVWRYKEQLTPQQIIDYLPVIHEPKDFSILSTADLMAEYKEASTSNVSPFYLRRTEEEIVMAKFSNDPDTLLRNIAIIHLNPFPNMSQDDLLTALSSQTIKKNDWIKANYIEILVDEAIKKNKNFLEMDLVDKDAVLDKIIADRFETTGPELVPGEDGEIPERVDVEAEAKAKLRGTVGGVQGVIEINKAVAEGMMSESSAELLLIELFGLDSSIAARLIDTPKQNPVTKPVNVTSTGNIEEG